MHDLVLDTQWTPFASLAMRNGVFLIVSHGRLDFKVFPDVQTTEWKTNLTYNIEKEKNNFYCRRYYASTSHLESLTRSPTCYCSLPMLSLTRYVSVLPNLQHQPSMDICKLLMPQSKLLCCLVLDALFHQTNSQPHFLRPPWHLHTPASLAWSLYLLIYILPPVLHEVCAPELSVPPQHLCF